MSSVQIPRVLHYFLARTIHAMSFLDILPKTDVRTPKYTLLIIERPNHRIQFAWTVQGMVPVVEMASVVGLDHDGGDNDEGSQTHACDGTNRSAVHG